MDEEPDIVELFLKFLYTGEYDDNRRRRLSGKELRAARRAEAEAKAEKLQNTPSKRQKTNDEVEVVDHANEIALLTNTQVYIMAEKYDVQGLKELAKIKYEELVDYYWRRPSFVTTLRLLFEGTPESDPLMKVAIKTAGQNARELVDKGEFATLCKECGELGFEIFKASMEDDDKENEPTELATTLRVNGFSDSASDSSSHFDWSSMEFELRDMEVSEAGGGGDWIQGVGKNFERRVKYRGEFMREIHFEMGILTLSAAYEFLQWEFPEWNLVFECIGILVIFLDSSEAKLKVWLSTNP